ncbi:hypothetical protein BS17DRAFT_850512 [Gyrodon lividus]|nr:hypothetical protein BS17DRAFT_850512 [Gyrodon lividus]
MESIMEADNCTIDIDPATARQSGNSFMILTDLRMDETIPADNPSSPGVEVQSDLSDLSYLNIELSDEDIEPVESLDIEEQPAQQEVDAVTVEQPHSEDDLCLSIPGMYRILDLMSERGTSGLVDKIIIAQDSLKTFVNEICPGAYASLTKVDFKALDKRGVKPAGIYGSKEEIVRFLLSFGVVDDAMAAKLVDSTADSSIAKPTLRSSLYITRVSQTSDGIEKIFVIYWPEETTWDDDASPPVCRNRVAFMRYLTKICDQVIALVSEEHAKSIVWSDPVNDDNNTEDNEDDTDRLFTFEVAKTNEQEEGVSVRPGFKVRHPSIIIVTEPHPQMEAELSKPRLVHGETRQGFMTTRYLPGKRSIKSLNSFNISSFLLQDALHGESLQILETIGPRSLHLLLRLGLSKRFPEQGGIWASEVRAIKLASQKQMETLQQRLHDELTEGESRMESIMRVAVANAVFHNHPFLKLTGEDPLLLQSPHGHDRLPSESYSSLTNIHPRIAENLKEELRRSNCKNIYNPDFRTSKEKILVILHISQQVEKLTEVQLAALVQSAMEESKRHFRSTLASVLREISVPAEESLPSKPTSADTRNAEEMLKDGCKKSALISDEDFISDLEYISGTIPTLREAVTAAKDMAQKYLDDIVEKLCKNLLKVARRVQIEDCRSQAKAEADHRNEQEIRNLSISLIQKINLLSQHLLRLKSIVPYKQFSHRRMFTTFAHPWAGFYGHLDPPSYEITGDRETSKEATLLFTIHLLHLTTQDQHELQLDPTIVPNPRFKESYSFQLPLAFSVSYAQLLEGDRLLLALIDCNANLFLFLDHLNSIEISIGRERGKMLHRDKIGQEFLLAFDESQGMLAVVGCEKLQLHVFVYDVSQGFTAFGSTINLNSWYGERVVIKKACFISGSEELLLVDSQALARVFSLTTMQFRPASMDLHRVPTGVYSSPDGSCFVAAISDGTTTRITAYHWSTFGSNEGIPLSIGDWAGEDDLVLTSLVRRNAVYLLKLDLASQACSSVALDITRKVTEFMFKEKDGRGLSRDAHFTAHNCVMDCHAEVWTRFPVLPAVQRATISSNNRCRRSILFVTDRDHHRYSAHFADTVEAFERTSKKPTGDRLSTLSVSATTFEKFAADFSSREEWSVSLYKVGEWVVDMLCLIPIHLALARDNRFVPLKDGVYSPEVEKSLLGADINRIVDSISFGWYESIFQSYMADKPVRVVSSMGEQSVGKSFTLNHLVDTSFAGSAMRTTEGVWMSVTPTKEALIVALDFEGVHSIERSAQEDTLLVLFNTAISNLVLFRNNFALSRDITGLFQSFQSGSTVLDPVANPALFQSTLVIIIKDVVDSDKTEIAREFSLKFQQIVQEEQDANFISRLHGGKLNIIPWPVIESREFYKLFATLKRRLDQQEVTHKAAGEFLHLMKTLMAKLKANDWGALSQTMASHRAQLLLALLPTTLAFGLQAVEPEIEPLKNLDTDIPVDSPDTDARFFVTSVEQLENESGEELLDALLTGWVNFDSRQCVPDAQWAEELSKYLEDLADMRINHVRAWVRINLTRFQTGHASVMELQRTVESAVIDLKSSVQLCRMQCSFCQLLCIQNRLHDGPHDCQTEHTCTRMCEFCVELEIPEESEAKKCSMTAGHPGKHVCAVNVHYDLCGAPCKLWGKSGCLGGCSKVSGHEDEDHQCAAITHACGEPCDLSLATLADGSQYTCKGRCKVIVDVEHDDHQCDAQYCPISCQLCKRLCSSHSHLHALEADAIHLCGQEHPCPQRCTAPGVCEIDTAPQSIEATFKGMHECFHYTRVCHHGYLVAKRLKCVRPIPPGKLQHEGSHDHSLDPDVVHYCQERCANCQYFCTLPLGHSQKEHETRHGSMSNVRWSVDGPDEEGLEVEGRRFSTNDDGAPMMCNLVCQALGRHVHIDYCRAKSAIECRGNHEVQHVARTLRPDPDRPKDFLTHSLFWKRRFKDPYSREEQANFGKCDSMCAGSEHAATAGKPAAPSYCILPLFHSPLNPNSTRPKQGYVTNDGHQFTCLNPASIQQAFHVIFLIDRSASMRLNDRGPLKNSPVYGKICTHMNNRLGAVYSSLYSFWTARMAAVGQRSLAHRDSYSIILHDQVTEIICENDLTKSPDQLLDLLLPNSPKGGNSFNKALKAAEAVMTEWWADERRAPPPVIIFLSDGIASFSDKVVQKLFRRATQMGKALSLHAILFGPTITSDCLRRMITVALDEQSRTPTMASTPSSFHEALDTVKLAQTFLGIAESLRKPRGALIQ